MKMNNFRSKKLFRILLALLVSISVVTCIHISIYAQEESQQSEVEILEQVKSLLDEGLEYLKLGNIERAKSKFEEALKIAPEGTTKEIEGLISRADDIAERRERLTGETIIKSEEKAKKITDLKQKIMEFEKEQREKENRRIINSHLDKGRFYYDKGRYEEALIEFNKILIIEPENEEAISYIEETKIAREKSKDRAEKKEALTRRMQVRDYWGNAKRYYSNKRYDDAIKELKKILAINPTDTEAIEYMQLAEEMKLFGAKIDEAERLEDMVNEGKEYLRDRDYDKAIEIWRQVLEEKEDYPGIEVLITQAKFAKLKGERKIPVEKERTDRERKWLEIDEAYVPVVGGEKEEKKKEVMENEELLAIEKIRNKAKEQKVSMDFTDTDLRSVVLYLSRQSGINMMFDEAVFETEEEGRRGRADEEATVPVRVYNVTVSLRDMPLLDALGLILRSRGLEYEIRPNVIWISTRDRIENVPLEPLETRVFDIQFGGPFRGQTRPEPLELETITFGE